MPNEEESRSIDFDRLHLWNMEGATREHTGFHMPGHSGGRLFTREYAERLLLTDTTELESTDDLHDPSGPARLALDRISEIYGSEESLFITTGSTTGIFVMLASVLTDVPCSGLGLLRKKPEIRSTMTYAAIMELVEVQKMILAHAAEFVRPGGTLLYSTCTINPLENQGQMETFLANHPDFAPYPFPERVPEALGLRASRHKTEANEGYMTLLPDDDACDGFFIARLRRETE